MNINVQDMEILTEIKNHCFYNQRDLAQKCGHSLGSVNASCRRLKEAGFLDEEMQLTACAEETCRETAPRNAIILAAGYGMRMVPINNEYPKALLEVRGERLIERQIRQLHEVGIREIYIVVGFMKEKFEYLIDKFQVSLVVNAEYSHKNNLHSLYLLQDKISNSYIIPSDLYCVENPFRCWELYSWYMMSDAADQKSEVSVNGKREIIAKTSTHCGRRMIGIAYITCEDADRLQKNLFELDRNINFEDAFWERALQNSGYRKGKLDLYARVVSDQAYLEINTYEQLREVDSNSNGLKSDAIDLICEALDVTPDRIVNIEVLKKGMTNRSFLFACDNQKYIMRIPGEGTDYLINRREEAAVYGQIKDLGICDDLVYINPQNGYKITKYLQNARVCDADHEEDLNKCMKKLREFHQLHLQVDHEFNIYEKIDFYESLWNGLPSVYDDYAETKQHVLELQSFINRHVETRCLTHIDAVPDNFLFSENADGEEVIRLIDWEYAGMQDPHVDVAMFCIYALYDRAQVDRLIDIYFEGCCSVLNRLKIYSYIAACGLLWSNWCEYKRNLGVEFGEYSLRQYRYAKEYYRIVRDECKKEGIELCIK